MARGRLVAYIDEAGQRARTSRSSSHFVLSAVVFHSEDEPAAIDLLQQLRVDLRRRAGDPLHWQNVKSHTQRLRLAQGLGTASWLTVASVVVCKDHLAAPPLDDDGAYLYTLRFLLERLSWLSRDRDEVLTYTLAHVVRFKIAKLREYEAALQDLPDCRVEWSALDPHGGYVDQPSRVEYLQLADAAASATFAAFEPDRFGFTERRYLEQLAPVLYRRPPGPLTTYGLKMHPWTDATRAAYPWVAAL